MPTPQTLREQVKLIAYELSRDSKDQQLTISEITSRIEPLLARFSTILEEVIGEDVADEDKAEPYTDERYEQDAQNALRQHQRIIGKDYLK